MKTILLAIMLLMITSAIQAASSTVGIKIRIGEDRRAKVTIVGSDPRNNVTDVSVTEATKILREWVGSGSRVRVGIIADNVELLGYLPLLAAISENSDLGLAFIDGAPDLDRVSNNIRTRIEQAGAGQPATRPVDDPEGGDQPQPEAEERSR